MRPERPNIEAEGMGFFGRGQQAPSRQLVALEEHCVPSGVWDGAPAAQRFSTIFST